MSIKFSIITVCYNAERSIGKTIDSVLQQSYSNYELIVKDGLSSDHTLEIIPASEKIRVFSEKDSGIYDAMNQAVAYADGDYLIFMNAGDLFYSSCVLQKVADFIDRNPADIIYGDYCRNGVIVQQPSNITEFALFRNPLNHQSIFFRKDSIHTPWYNTNYRVLADYDLTVSTFVQGKEFAHIEYPIDYYEGNGFSETPHGRKLFRNENRIIRSHHFSKKFLLYTVLHTCTLPKLRGMLVKDSTPYCIRFLYRKITNFINHHIT